MDTTTLRILKLLWGLVLKEKNPWDTDKWECYWASRNGTANRWAEWDRRRTELTRKMFKVIFKGIIISELAVRELVIEALNFLGVEK